MWLKQRHDHNRSAATKLSLSPRCADYLDAFHQSPARAAGTGASADAVE